jgi:hypothetical protein
MLGNLVARALTGAAPDEMFCARSMCGATALPSPGSAAGGANAWAVPSSVPLRAIASDVSAELLPLHCRIAVVISAVLMTGVKDGVPRTPAD